MIKTHLGLYKISCLAFGIKVAPSIFQQVMDMMLSELDFVVTYLDDILLKSENQENTRKMFSRISEGFRIQAERPKIPIFHE